MAGKIARIAGTVAVASIVAGLLAAFWVGQQLTRPVPARVGPAPADLAAESISFESQSGSLIRGWLSRGNGDGVVLLLTSIRANRVSMIDRARFLRAAGYSTLLIDFQATGESPGSAITFGWSERLDVMAAVQTLQRLMPGQPVGIIGTSLGGAATLLAVPDLDIQAAVLEAVYPSLDVALENRVRIRVGALAPVLTPFLLAQLRLSLGVWPSELRPIDRIARLGCPVLVIGGALDRHTTVTDTRRLYEAAREPKALWLVPDAAHVDYHHASGDYEQRVLDFFERTLRNQSD